MAKAVLVEPDEEEIQFFLEEEGVRVALTMSAFSSVLSRRACSLNSSRMDWRRL